MAYRRHYTPLYFVNFDSGANRRRDTVYEDHSALSGMGAHQSYGYGGAGYLGLFMQLLPYMLQTGILILFAVLFCWVSAGFWTALMGFLQLLIGRDKYSISASTVGDEPLNPGTPDGADHAYL